MATRTPRVLSLLCAGLLLLAQALPAYAVCVCDELGRDPCCDAPAEPVADPIPGCCAEPEPVEPTACCSEEPEAQVPGQVSLSAPCCARAIVATDLGIAALPTESVSDGKPLGSSQVVPTGTFAEVLAHQDHSASCPLRGPPLSPPAPLFLLNASFLA